ncbi:DUF2279 domain-containing protein [Winogradskyella bathintestinalis]|uniref:DUF2279 domain-containing protein n=1 Tax=Winogradskyella bathintestinalis TaxID=3035208 RepID=A0ABT7ZZ79_9FLAO|nr:DUF2279 domain-containing protein [Winogradskyella bathintestinalis]MDN3494033.1 DUF2279 domain-containing protein [Winogradskyella bathintestinalis]
MKWGLSHIVLLFLVSGPLFSQSKFNLFLKPSDSLNESRRNTVVLTQTTVASATLLGLNQLWYADYSRSNFKTLNDSNEWLQMDKMGHVFSSYQLGRLGANTLNWAGVSKKDQILYGSTLGFGFLTAVEVMDGFSEEWGFSWTDIAANSVGTGLHVGQELLWEEQRIVLKYSFHRTHFAEQRPNKLGNGFLEEFLKDYNGQTYWLSANINSFLKTEAIPNWLNLAIGYGAEGMLTGKPNGPLFLNQNRTRQYYLSLDVDLTRVKTNSHVLKTIFDVFNVIKVPFPTLELNDNGRLKWHGVYF